MAGAVEATSVDPEDFPSSLLEQAATTTVAPRAKNMRRERGVVIVRV